MMTTRPTSLGLLDITSVNILPMISLPIPNDEWFSSFIPRCSASKVGQNGNGSVCLPSLSLRVSFSVGSFIVAVI